MRQLFTMKEDEMTRFALGDTVVFVGSDEEKSGGIVTSIGVSWVFVRFPPDETAIACHPDRLMVVR